MHKGGNIQEQNIQNLGRRSMFSLDSDEKKNDPYIFFHP